MVNMQGQDKKIKILYVITKSNWGGAQKYVYELATNLPRDKFDVAVILGGDGILLQKLRDQNIRIVNLENLERDINIFKEFAALIALIKIFRKEKPSIIHLNSSKIGGLGALAGRIYNLLNKLEPKSYKLKAKLIFTAHGFAFNEDRPWLVKAVLFLLNYVTIILSHKTVTINRKEFGQVSKLPFVKKKLELIYIGISESPKIVPTKKDTLHYAQIVVGTISELTKNKGLEYAIEAIARLKNQNVTFSIIGEGEERKNLEQLIKEKGVEDRIKLLGFKDGASMYLNLFDIFILTSVKEGLPYSILEAGLARLPVIASDVGGIGEIIENGKSGILVESKNVEEIVTALTSFIDNPEKRKGLGENLKDTVTKKFSLKKMLDETQKLYWA